MADLVPVDHDPFEDETAGAMSPETFVPPIVRAISKQTAQNDVNALRNFATMTPPDRSQEHVAFKTADPRFNITQEDIDRAMNVAMSAGVGATKGKAPALDMAEGPRMARAAEQGYTGPWYHGADRMDRFTESGKIDPKRATSGPMPYFTDNPEIASNYAKGKMDTSLPDNGQVAEYFTVAPKDLGLSGRRPYTVEQSWHFLPPEVRKDIMNKATRVGHTDLDMAEGPLMLHPEGTNATGAGMDHWNYILNREARGNPLTALRDLWHDSGRFVDDPGQLSEIYRLAGYPHPISEASAPWTEAKGVFPGMLRMRNPLPTDDTKVMTEKVLPALEEAFKRDRTRTQQYGADQWDKNTRFTPKEWVQQAKEDYAKGDNSFVWTSIPDKVTAELRRLGYDGILDTGGKMGGQGHRVAVPFGPEQVRSRFAKFDPNAVGENGLLRAIMGAPVAAGAGASSSDQITDLLKRYGIVGSASPSNAQMVDAIRGGQ